MKLLNLALSLVFVATSSMSFASQKVLSAKEVLTAQHAELSDLESQLTYQKRIKTAGWVGIAVSSAAVTYGLFFGVADSVLTAGLNLGADVLLGEQAVKVATSQVPNLVVLGGVVGVGGSAVLVYIESKKIDDLISRIEAKKKEIAVTIQRMN